MKQNIINPCQCSTCVNMCKNRPCWATPEEASALIEAGYGDKLMHDWWVGSHDDINLVSPAMIGHECGRAPDFYPIGRCVFLTGDDKCELHDLGLKPIEGREATCQGFDGSLHERVAKTWEGSSARKVYELWRFDFYGKEILNEKA